MFATISNLRAIPIFVVFTTTAILVPILQLVVKKVLSHFCFNREFRACGRSALIGP